MITDMREYIFTDKRKETFAHLSIDILISQYVALGARLHQTNLKEIICYGTTVVRENID